MANNGTAALRFTVPLTMMNPSIPPGFVYGSSSTCRQLNADDDVNEGIRITSMVLNQRLVRFCRQTTPKTIQEMQTYSWDAKAAQRGEEKPLKIHDHGPDAFRYFAKSEVPYWRLGCD